MKTIVLIGMMGSGKTTIGKLLGEKLTLRSIDIDVIIEQNEKRTVSEIFQNEGEKYFRNIERETIKKNFTNKDLIISLGGGAFEDQLTQELLLKNSTVIYLKTSPNVILERIKNNTNRPLLKNQMTVEKIQSIILQRQKNYELANITILTDNKNTDKIVEEILGVI
ncbi:TPA: shikimate kinase [Candidatus Gastranaerophilales bacterium HUM_6]|jgi:shikimate kinase|nr:shikimate kinase [bacterium]MEE0496126.1 shikimate kinase [Cyanobacteriota bacterium]CDE92942.1 shikimate kinase [Fusobacterium sp. CAG:815]DAA89935.1 MAG TPA: shikimate kinase [Candidatus Gastranaerophilales bacterium HUM_6]DAA93696.1 MAG TPA: shikimate kinase [Candidatus Gastranaerophilales bacterium HUM_7]DAB02314.1 MAG TPA: shikimate kinase [Candidatus Gastranaerophilales bacterium HUM_12]DAB07242.1 MAG TPA: shikimate kinase [Candidatus Gastranaerophilales bacterium HUM_14]